MNEIIWHDKNDIEKNYSQICSRGRAAHQHKEAKKIIYNYQKHNSESNNILSSQENCYST